MKFFFFFIIIILYSTGSFSQRVIDSLGIKFITSINCSPVKDQSLSSTCWSFASSSFLESELFLQTNKKTELSEMFLARYSYINKISKYLETQGTIFFTPGGQFHDVTEVIQQHGIIPYKFYTGKLNGEAGYDHSELDTAMKYYADSLVQQGETKLFSRDSVFIEKLLNKYIGVVPSGFTYNGITYTPKTFAEKVLNFNKNNYIEITSYLHHPFYKTFMLNDKYNWMLHDYLNVPLTDFMEIVDSAIANGHTVCWDGDVEDDGFEFNKGIAFLNSPVADYESERQNSYDNHTTSIDHMMQVTGMAKDKENHTWYYLKNSWGNSNSLGGYLFMRDDYFKVKTVAIVVSKAAIPDEVCKKIRLNIKTF